MTILSDDNDGKYADNLLNYDDNLLFNVNGNGQLSETGDAVVTFANTEDNGGSYDKVVLSGTVYVSGIVAGFGADGTAGAGQILEGPSATINGGGGTVVLSAGSGIGVPETFIDITNATGLDATTQTGGIYIQDQDGAASTLILSASTTAGDVDVSSGGEIDLSSSDASSIAAGLPLWTASPRRVR